jgi:hypothetical protein
MRGAPQSGLARLISRISRRTSNETCGLPARRRDFQRQKRAQACLVPADNVFRFSNRDRIQNARCNPIEADETCLARARSDRVRRPFSRHFHQPLARPFALIRPVFRCERI